MARLQRLMEEAAVLQRHGNLAEAERRYHRACALAPEDPDIRYNLASVLQQLGRHKEAIENFLKSNRLGAENADALVNIGVSLQALGQQEEAIATYRKAFVLKPDFAEAHNNTGNALQALGRHDEALRHYELAIACKPSYAVALSNLGNALNALGRPSDAIGRYREALALDPSMSSTHSNLLLALNYLNGLDPSEIFAEHKAWALRHAEPLSRNRPAYALVREPGRRLRIGYVSPDFRQHSVAFFIAPLLEEHDRREVEVICLSDVTKSDATTARLRRAADEWHEIAALDDADVARLVRGRRIDILVDLAGHTAGNRLLAFARRPAPVQVSWLGYLNSTGLAAMDWRITDAIASPLGAERLHTERLQRLPHCQWCYQPPAAGPNAGPLPALSAGHVTFAAFHNLAKVNDEVIALWARVLNAVPGARLMVVPANSPRVPAGVVDRFVQYGISAGRLDLREELPLGEYLALHARVDIGLDTFPYSGGTSTFHSLWMGVPVVAFAGDTMTSRGGASILAAAGLADLVARTADGYVEFAVRLASDLPSLARLRAGLRARLKNSPLTDAAGFARRIEDAYRGMWREWCAASDTAG